MQDPNQENIINAGLDINFTALSTFNVVVALTIPMVICVLLLIFYKKIQ